MALTNLWQQHRQQRQLEVLKRQQQVREFIVSVQQERQIQAQQLQSELSQFRDNLTTEVESFLQLTTAHRSWTSEVQTEKRQQFVLNLQQQTQAFLAAVQAQRQEQATEVRIYLAGLKSQRGETTQALFKQLANFRSDLHSYIWGMETEPNTIPTLAAQPSVSPSPAKVATKPKLKQPIPAKTKTISAPTLKQALTQELVKNLVAELSRV